MSIITKKNCLLVFRNKKVNVFDGVDKLISSFSNGYWFDKVSLIAYDDAEEISRAMTDAKANYENILLYVPYEMENAVKQYTEGIYGTQFDKFGVLNSQNSSVFIMFSDAKNRISIKDIIEILDKKYAETYEKAFVLTVGAPIEKITKAIAKAKEQCKDIEFGIKESYGECRIRLVYNSNVPKMAFDSAYRALLSELNDYLYALEDISLAERLVQLLKLRRMKIAVAESFTGGGICKRLVEVPGVSEVFFEGLNTYSNEAKMARLGVKELTLKNHGAVSEETACEMAEGLLADGTCDVGIATTGIAGPKSDNTNKPVGLIYIAVSCKDGTSVFKYNLSGTRKNITETAINLALFLAFKLLK